MSIICSKCSNRNEDNDLFCSSCGEIIGGKSFQNQEVLKQHSQNICNFIEKIQSSKNQGVTSPLAELNETFEKANNLQSFLEIYKEIEPNDTNIQNFLEQIQKFLYQDNDFQIAFVGTVKAGKSTLINAILKQDFASTSATPETAVLTKFKYGENNSIKITFYTREEWDKLWASATANQNKAGAFLDEFKSLNAEAQIEKYVGHDPIIEQLDKDILKKYTGSTDAVHYFVKEAEISFRDFPIADKNIVFVDTPGLDDAVDYRSQVTRDYIKRANLVLMCIKVDPIHNTELQTIIRTFDNTCGNPEKVFLLGTQYDIRNKPIKEWEELKTEWMKHVVSKEETDKTKLTPSLAKTHILPVAAYISLLCDIKRRGTNFSEDKQEQLENICFKLYRNADIDKHLDGIYEFANIKAVYDAISNFTKGSKDYVINDAKISYKNLSNEIINYFQSCEQSLGQTYSIGQSDVQKITEKIMEEKNKLKELEIAQNEFREQLSDFKSEANKVIKKLGDDIEEMIKSIK